MYRQSATGIFPQQAAAKPNYSSSGLSHRWADRVKPAMDTDDQDSWMNQTASAWAGEALLLLGATMMEWSWTTVQGIRLDFSQAHFWRVTGSESVGWMWGVKICSKVFLSETLEQDSKIKLVFISKSVRSESGFLTVHDPHSNPDASIERTSSGSTRCCSEGKQVSGATGRSSL